MKALLLIILLSPLGAQSLELTEKLLAKLAQEKTPTLMQLSLSQGKAENAKREYQDGFRPSLFSGMSYLKTNENPFITFQPVISPLTYFEVGVQKKFKRGIDSKVTLTTDRREFDLAGVPETRGITYAALELTIDLWKNFLGRSDQANLKSLEALWQQSKVQQQIGTHNFLIQLRQIFWNTMALEESIKISDKLYRTALRQEGDALQRYKSSVADKGELARYRAQTATRSSQVTALKYQKEQSLRQLKTLVGDLKQQELELPEVNLSRMIKNVTQCVLTINSYKKVPLENTLYDELNAEIDKYQQQQKTLAKTYSDVDVKLTAQGFTRAASGSVSDSFSDAFAENRQGFQVGLNVSVPLGHKKTERQKEQLADQEGLLRQQEISQQLAATHDFIRRSVNYLMKTIDDQKRSKSNLQIRIKDMRRKYKQGRVSVTDYINDQDALLKTELDLVQTKNSILQTLLNYFSFFGLTPCKFNQVSA